jgi:integrase/recombinase XerC
VRAPKAPKPLPKALAVDQAVALAEQSPTADGRPDLLARDHAIVELLYGCGLRVGELLGLDVAAGPGAAAGSTLADATAHVLGKGSKRRSVPVGGPALQALQAWLVVRRRWPRPASRRCSSASAARG